MSFWTNADGAFTRTERMRITSAGNVGIGTTAPVSPLEVLGSTSIALRVSSSVALGTGSGSVIIASTPNIPTAVDQRIGGFAGGALTVGTTYGSPAAITMWSAEAWSETAAGAYMRFETTPTGSVARAERMRITTAGNVGIGTTAPAFTLEVNGSFAATTKSFVIDHPTQPGRRLCYASLEGPENGVYVRGRLTGSNIIDLPDYWTGLVHEDSITVTLTPTGHYQKLYVEQIAHNQVKIATANLLERDIDCYYVVHGERADVGKLVVEI
jgi:hypothetical protein